MNCIRCSEAQAPGPLGFCPSCALNARLELLAGLRRLSEYLGAWAAFADWLDQRGREAG